MLIYHNPKCSKSRQTLQLLEDRGETPTVVEYLKEPLGEEQIREVLALLQLTAHEIVRTGEQEYKELALSPNSSDDEIIAAIARHPRLLQQPIVVKDRKAVIGRPPENVFDL